MDKHFWQTAIYSQSACNLSGLAHSLHSQKSILNPDHDYTRLLVAQMTYLAFRKSLADGEVDVSLPTTFPELIDSLIKTLEKLRPLDTDSRNTHPDIKKHVRALCETCHHGNDPFGWRWDVAYYRAQVLVGINPYSNTEPLTEEKAAEMLKNLGNREKHELEEEKKSVECGG